MAAVNRPTNVAQKQADIDQKLRLYGIFNGEFFIATFQTAHREAGVPQTDIIEFNSFQPRQSPIGKFPSTVEVEIMMVL